MRQGEPFFLKVNETGQTNIGLLIFSYRVLALWNTLLEQYLIT